MGPSHKAAARFGSRSHSLLGAPRKWGKKKEKISYVLPQLYNSRRVRWFCPGATSSERQRFEIHRAVSRHTALLEERRWAIKANIADSLNIVVHVERRPGRRYISELLVINRYDPDADLFDYGAVFLAKQDHT